MAYRYEVTGASKLKDDFYDVFVKFYLLSGFHSWEIAETFTYIPTGETIDQFQARIVTRASELESVYVEIDATETALKTLSGSG